MQFVGFPFRVVCTSLYFAGLTIHKFVFEVEPTKKMIVVPSVAVGNAIVHSPFFLYF